MNWMRGILALSLPAVGLIGASLEAPRRAAREAHTRGGSAAKPTALKQFVQAYCLDCHGGNSRSGGLALDKIVQQPTASHAVAWEKVLRKLRARQMPPAGRPRPNELAIEASISSLEDALDRAAAAHPDPGRTESLRRLTATEYQNSIRDLLALEIDGAALLPREPASNRFDTVAVGDLSPAQMDRYLSAAQKISRIAVGSVGRSPGGDTFRLPPDLTQEEHVPGLPVGTRGGALFHYTFPATGEYEISVRLTRDRNEEVEGLHESHELEMLLDRERQGLFIVRPPKSGEGHMLADQHLKKRIRIAAGPHELGVTFIKQPSSLLLTKRQPYDAHFNLHRHPRISPAVYQVSIVGPFDPVGPGDTPSRRRIFSSRPRSRADEEACAKRILVRLMRRAYRRPVTVEDLKTPMRLFRQARGESGFDAGIESALSAILVSPNFLFRIERDPSGLSPQAAYAVSDFELASRLSFFLWSSIPDDELLDLAERKQLHRPETLTAQAVRMLKDPRAEALVTNFAEQWLHLRNLASVTPDLRLFPEFDDNLRQSMRQETEMFLESVIREDRSVLDLLSADYTYLNERLAKHYSIPHVYGSRFRRVSLGGERTRGGLLRQGSILTVTSYATRTSPVLRGKWVLENVLGAPPPPPPGNVPALKDNTVAANLTVRERLSEHRKNPACSGCHSTIDPVGFALENYDAIGRWREVEEGAPVDSRGSLLDSSPFGGVKGLEQALKNRPELFVQNLTENLMMYGLGRVIDEHDAPAVRKVVRSAKKNGYRFSSLIVEIVNSVPFRMRRAQ